MESRGTPNVGPTLQVPSAVICRVGRRLPSEGKGHTFESCRVRLRISGVLLRADSQFRGLLAAEEQDRPPACQDAHAADGTAVPPSPHHQTWPGHKPNRISRVGRSVKYDEVYLTCVLTGLQTRQRSAQLDRMLSCRHPHPRLNGCTADQSSRSDSSASTKPSLGSNAVLRLLRRRARLAIRKHARFCCRRRRW